jgi:poly(A) polymerase
MIGQEQPPRFHPEGDVFVHTLLMLNLMKQRPGPRSAYTPRELAYAVLLHDAGKPPTARMGTGADGTPRIRFDGHAEVGADMADTILKRLRFPNRERNHIVDAIRGHMRFMEVQNMRQAKLRRMIGRETFALEMELHRLDCLGSHEMLENYDYLKCYIEAMENEPILPEPWINGNDLIAMGFREGKLIGSILRDAYDAQMENRVADRQALLDWIKSTYRS